MSGEMRKCARCGLYKYVKVCRVQGSYQGKELCGTCTIVVSFAKNQKKKKEHGND